MGASITLAGENLIAQKQAANVGLKVVRFIFANVPGLDTSGPVNRAAGKPAAAQIVHSYLIPDENAGYVNPNQIVYSSQIGSDVGDWDFNWIGLETAENVLFAVAYVPVQQKRRNIPPLQIGNNLTRNFLVVFDGAQALTGITIDANTWQHDFTVRLAGIDERERQSNRDIYGRACFFGSSLQVEKVGGVYQVKPGIAYVEGIRLQRSTALPIVPPAFPTTAWLDIALQRELSDVVASWQVVFAADRADYTDSAGAKHYCVPIADLPSANSITDRRYVEAITGTLIDYLAPRSYVQDYVRSELDKLDAKQSVRVASTTDLVLSGLQAVDGIALVASDRVLVTAQGNPVQNGIYTVAAGAWLRSADADANLEVTPGMLVPVEQGTVNADSLWQLVTDAPILLGSTGLVFEMAAGPSGLTAGTYRSVTVNKRGQVTGGTNPTTLAGYGITDALKVGVNGIGATSNTLVPGAQGINGTDIPGGQYRYDSNIAGSKPGSGTGVVLIGRIGAEEHTQLAVDYVGGATFIRVFALGAFTPWVEISNATQLPVGVPFPWPTQTPPANCLAMAGQAFNPATFPALSALYPSNVLPDLRGEFIRGWDGGRGVDAGRAIVSAQLDALQNITGAFGGAENSVSTTGAFANGGAFGTVQAGPNYRNVLTFDASRVARTSTETRPRNIAFNYICRAK